MFAGIRKNSDAMEILSNKQEVISNNLANVNTVGFRKDSVAVSNFADVLQAAVYNDGSMGAFRQTGNPADLAIEGEGYFTIQTPQGLAYTRNGSFHLTPKGELVTQDGMNVLSESGPIVINPEEAGSFTLGRDGHVHAGGADLGKVRVMTFGPGSALSKAGHNRVTLVRGGANPSNANVVQGAVEESTSQTVPEMTEMIDTLRQFEANQKAIRMQDDSLGRAISTLGGY